MKGWRSGEYSSVSMTFQPGLQVLICNINTDVGIDHKCKYHRTRSGTKTSEVAAQGPRQTCFWLKDGGDSTGPALLAMQEPRPTCPEFPKFSRKARLSYVKSPHILMLAATAIVF